MRATRLPSRTRRTTLGRRHSLGRQVLFARRVRRALAVLRCSSLGQIDRPIPVDCVEPAPRHPPRLTRSHRHRRNRSDAHRADRSRDADTTHRWLLCPSRSSRSRCPRIPPRSVRCRASSGHLTTRRSGHQWSPQGRRPRPAECGHARADPSPSVRGHVGHQIFEEAGPGEYDSR
jgi:hypothetical protein